MIQFNKITDNNSAGNMGLNERLKCSTTIALAAVDDLCSVCSLCCEETI